MPMRIKGIAGELPDEGVPLAAVIGLAMGLTRDEVISAAFYREMRDHQHDAATTIPVDGDITAIVMRGLVKLAADLEAAEKRP
jgi:hypothetical protein